MTDSVKLEAPYLENHNGKPTTEWVSGCYLNKDRTRFQTLDLYSTKDENFVIMVNSILHISRLLNNYLDPDIENITKELTVPQDNVDQVINDIRRS